MRARIRCGLLLTALSLSTSARALDLDSDMFSLRGFGTLGVTHSSEDRADMPGNFVHPDGAGYSRDWSPSVDSKLGLQLDARFDEQWSAVIQLVSQYDYRGTYRPEIEWAYIDYAVTPDLNIRVGRKLTAMFMESENRLVGYTYNPVRPPTELYDVYPLTNEDGIDIRYRFAQGDAVHTMQASYGERREKFRRDGVGRADPIWNVHYLLEVGPTSFRVGYVDMTLDVTFPALDALSDGLAQFSQVPGPAGEQAATNHERFRADKTRYRITTVGASHQAGPWRVQAEWATADMEVPTPFAGIRAWYTTVSYRIGALTPYALMSKSWARNVPDPTPIPTAGLPPELAQAGGQLNAGVAAVATAFAFSQESVGAGVRWDATDNIDLKLQVERLRTGNHNYGRLINVQPDFEPGETFHAISVTMDFVF